MVQALKHRPGDYPYVWRQPMSVALQRGREGLRRLWDAGSQGHVWAPCIIMQDPLLQDVPQVRGREWDQKIEAFAP